MAIGGGTGLSTLLGGLKQHVDVEIGPPGDGLTAIVTVTDNGGSSGRLREEFNILPPGDIRNCMVALAEDEQLLTRLFRYRFAGEGTLGAVETDGYARLALAGCALLVIALIAASLHAFPPPALPPVLSNPNEPRP